MPFVFDESNNQISMPPGDTGNLWIEIDWTALSDGDAVLFAIVDRNGNDLMVKSAEITTRVDADDNVIGTAHIRLCNHDTREIEPGRYYWQLRVVTNPGKGENGELVADDCSDNVVSVFENMPSFRLVKKGGRV